MPIHPLHREVALIALGAVSKYGFALGGGNALMAHHIGDRPTQDVDLVTNAQDLVPVAAGEVEDALRAAGYKAERNDKAGDFGDIWEGLGEDMAEWLVTAPDGRQMMLQLAYFDRLLTPVEADGISPVLAIGDLVGHKAAAAAVRSYERDFIDLGRILLTYTVDEVIALALQADPGLEMADFAEAGRRLDETDDLAFARYGLDRAAVAALRLQFRSWPRTAPPRVKGHPADQDPPGTW
jgi:hypothetical protein